MEAPWSNIFFLDWTNARASAKPANEAPAGMDEVKTFDNKSQQHMPPNVGGGSSASNRSATRGRVDGDSRYGES